MRGELKDGDAAPEGELVTRYSVCARPCGRCILEIEALLTVTPRLTRRPARARPALAARHFGLGLQASGTTLADIYGARLLIEPSCVHLVATTARRTARRRCSVIAQQREMLAARTRSGTRTRPARFHARSSS